MTISVWQEMASDPITVTHDIAVVGAGLVGSHLASLLTKAGKDVALVEARHPAAGASGRNAGFVCIGVRHSYVEAIERWGRDEARDLWRLTEENVRRMRELSERFDLEHEEIGASYIATDGAFALKLRESEKLLIRDGFAAEYVAGDSLKRGFTATLLQPDDFGIQPASLNIALAESCGATLYDNDEVFDIGRDGSSLLVRTRQHLVRCEKVVLAVNGYAGLIHPFFRPLVEPGRGQVLVTEPLPKIVNTLGLVHLSWYFRQLSDGRLLIGGGRLDYEAEERTYSDEVTPQVQEVIGRMLAKHFPEANNGVTRRWAGIHGYTPDGLPIIGHLPDEPEVYFVVGFSGYGNSMGLVAGDRVADLMLNGQDPGIFRVNRFD
jgi:glycine/D-amino acid oxidase-like deaminating enzyme